MLFCEFLLLILFSIIFATTAQDNVASKFQLYKIVPETIPSAPENHLVIKYPSGVEVNYGVELTPTNVKDTPSVSWKANPEDFYTLIMVDLDAPSSIREVKHWMMVNIPGNNLANGETVADYVGGGPPLGDGIHRYTFFVYKQPTGKIDFSAEEKASNREVKGRLSFSTSKFAEKYSLQIFGGNFFQAQYDDYVPILHAQFKE